MGSDKQTDALKDEKKKKRLRFAGLVALTVAVIIAAVAAGLIARSCEATQNLDIGQTYDDGKAGITVSDIYIKRAGTTEYAYAIITVRIDAEKDYTLDPLDFELDGTTPMSLSFEGEDGKISTDLEKIQVAAGTSAEKVIGFMMPYSMKVSELTYKKAVIRVGSMTESENNLIEEKK